MSHKKFRPDRFSRFDVYWIQTNKQTDRQAKFIYRSTTRDLLALSLNLEPEFFSVKLHTPILSLESSNRVKNISIPN